MYSRKLMAQVGFQTPPCRAQFSSIDVQQWTLAERTRVNQRERKSDPSQELDRSRV